MGNVEKVDKNVSQWKKGQRVDVGWHGNQCFECEQCRRGNFINCENAKICGISHDGGYAEYMTAPQEAVASIQKNYSSEEAAPLLCAGITVYNAMRNSPVRAGAVVAVQGIGGLGHLAVQYASKMGMRVVAISTSESKKELAKELCAHHFIATDIQDVVEELKKLGAQILSWPPHPTPMRFPRSLMGWALTANSFA